MTVSLLIPIIAFIAAAGADRRKWIYIPLVILAIPAPAVAATLAAIAVAWLARHYATGARPIATALLSVAALIGWAVGTGVTFHGYGMFSLLWVLAGLAVTGVMFTRAVTRTHDTAASETIAPVPA